MDITGIIDLQWFTTTVQDNRYIVKELAFSSLDRNCHQSFVFKPPTDTCSESNVIPEKADWITNFHFQLSWTDGDIPYSCLNQILLKLGDQFRIIYVKGLQKKTFLEKFLPQIKIINIEDFGCSKLILLNSKKTCLRKHSNCALANVDKIISWMDLYYRLGCWEDHW